MTSEDGHNYTFAMPEPPWLAHNDYFHVGDKHARNWRGYKLSEGWWSRHYEYPWAMKFAKPKMIVADMGCGYTWRPFADALSYVAEEVWAVDSNSAMLDLPTPENMMRVVADFTKPIAAIADETFDIIFCISVLEDVANPLDALKNFRRLLKPDGRIILTVDVKYDVDAPEHEIYKGLDLDSFNVAVKKAGLVYDGDIKTDRHDILYNEELNLCVYHAVLKRR